MPIYVGGHIDTIGYHCGGKKARKKLENESWEMGHEKSDDRPVDIGGNYCAWKSAFGWYSTMPKQQSGSVLTSHQVQKTGE